MGSEPEKTVILTPQGTHEEQLEVSLADLLAAITRLVGVQERLLSILTFLRWAMVVLFIMVVGIGVIQRSANDALLDAKSAAESAAIAAQHSSEVVDAATGPEAQAAQQAAIGQIIEQIDANTQQTILVTLQALGLEIPPELFATTTTTTTPPGG